MGTNVNLVVEKGNFFNMFLCHDWKDAAPVITVDIHQITGVICSSDDPTVKTVIKTLDDHWNKKCW